MPSHNKATTFKSNSGLTLLETIVASAIMLIVVGGLMAVYIQSITSVYTTDKLTEAQKQANNSILFLSQDLSGAEEFLFVSNTTVIVRTYKETTVGFYRNASDSTLRRVTNMSLTGGTIKARYITKLNFSYYYDTTFRTTLSTVTINSLRFDVLIGVPSSSLTDPNSLDAKGYSVGSYVWCRNRTTN